MKGRLLLFVLAVSVVSPVCAIKFDGYKFRKLLNGFVDKNHRTAYFIHGSEFASHWPVSNPTADGGLLITVKIDHNRRFASDDHAYLEAIVDKTGHLRSASTMIEVGGKKFDTGPITKASLKSKSTGTTLDAEIGDALQNSLRKKLAAWKFTGGRFALAAVARLNLDALLGAIKK